MELPIYQIQTLIRSGRIKSMQEVFDYGTVEQWSKLTGLRRDLIERIRAGQQKKFMPSYVGKTAQALNMEFQEIEAVVNGGVPQAEPAFCAPWSAPSPLLDLFRNR